MTEPTRRQAAHGAHRVSLRAATGDDLPWLAQMNAELIRAEGSRNPATLPQLETRMAGWLSTDPGNPWRVIVMTQSSTATTPDTTSEGTRTADQGVDMRVGYSVFRVQGDEYDPTRSEVYIRQLFVSTAACGAGVGRQVVAQLLTDWFPANAAITVETLASNPRATHFWQQVGFQPYAMTLRRELVAE